METRPPHHKFKWLVINAALADGPKFAATYAAKDGRKRLAALWTEANREVPAAQRIAPDGLALEVHGEPASPVMFVTLPAPRGNNEAFAIGLIPTESVPLRFRVFALEKGVFPKTGDELVFVVETTRTHRSNYGPPSDDSPDDTSRGAFVTAILEICDNKRKALAVTEI